MATKRRSKQAFADKWSPLIQHQGFTSIPNVLLKNLIPLKLKPAETMLLIMLLMYRWEADRMPRPSVKTMAAYMNVEPRHITRLLRSLEEKSLLKRYFRRNKTSEYDLKPLVDKLHNLAIPFDENNIFFNFGRHDNSVSIPPTDWSGGGDNNVR